MFYSKKSLFVLALSFGVASASQGAIITSSLSSDTGTSTDSHVHFQGTIVWSYTSGNHAIVTLNLTNNSTQSWFITGFGVGLANASINPNMQSSPNHFSELPNDELSFGTYGELDFGSGVSDDDDFDLSRDGIAIGQSGTWRFKMNASASTLAAVTNSAVYNSSNTWDFVVRFGEESDDNSDDAEFASSAFVNSPVPTPGALGLIVLAGIISRRRRS